MFFWKGMLSIIVFTETCYLIWKFGLHETIDLTTNHAYFWETTKGTNKPIVTFVCCITCFKNWSNISTLQNIRKASNFYRIIVNVREFTIILTGMSLKALALFLGSSFVMFVILSRWNSRKANFSLLLKCFRIFLIGLGIVSVDAWKVFFKEGNAFLTSEF